MEKPKIRQYTICEGSILNELEVDINDCIAHGFQPYGELKVILEEEKGETLLWYVQALVRYEESAEDLKDAAWKYQELCK